MFSFGGRNIMKRKILVPMFASLMAFSMNVANAHADNIENKKVAGAALDVFETEPKPEIQILMNPSLSLSPHIGGCTLEAQERIGTELAQQIIDLQKLI